MDDRDRVATAVAVALGAGISGGIQPKINAVLGARLGSSLVAALINFGGALVVVAIVLSMRPGTRAALRRIREWPVPRWTYSAGLGGVAVVLAGVVSVETIGVAVFSVAFFAGQIVAGLLVDRSRIAAAERRPVDAGRIGASALALVAVAVTQIGRPVGELVPLLVAFVVVAGVASAFQAAFNGRIAAGVGDAFAATSVNVCVGTAALACLVAATTLSGAETVDRWPTEPWLYAGGALGVSVVLALAIASRAIGVLRSTIAMLGAQLCTAFAVDWVVEGEGPTLAVLAGATLIVAAVVLVQRRPAVRARA